MTKAQPPSPKRARLIGGRPRRAGATRHTRALRVTMRASADGMRNAQLVLRDRPGHRIGASKRLNLGTHPCAVVIHLVRRWQPGRHTLRATAQTADGQDPARPN